MAIINPARQFERLIASDPVLTGTVTVHNADGTSSVTMTGGGVIRALGQTVAVNNIAMIQGNRIIGEAANLPAFNLDV